MPGEVIEAMADYLRRSNANLGGAFRTSEESDAVMARAREAAAGLTGSAPEEIAFGANMTTLNFLLAHAVARTLSPGDEIVVTDLDHDANVSPWMLVARDHGLVVRRAPIAPGTAPSTWTRWRPCSGSAPGWWRSRSPPTRSDRSPTPRASPPPPIAPVRSRGPTPCIWPPTGGCAGRSSGSTCCSARPTSSSDRISGWPRSSAGWPSRCPRTGCDRPRSGRRDTGSSPARSRTRR